ncbi:MAG: hypothetical protein AAGH99_12795 [Planctomycetota bacterium]
MGRRHGRTPPYEIMRNVGSGAPLPRSGVSRVRGGSVGFFGLIVGGLKSGWVGLVGLVGLGERLADLRSSKSGKGLAAVELRLPWPVLVLVGLGGVITMAVVFRAGQHVAGRSAGSESVEIADKTGPQGLESEVQDEALAAGQDPSVVEWKPLAQVEPVQPLGGDRAQDPRIPGLNYFVLVTVPPSEVDGVWALQEFLAERGVATFLDSTNNDRFRVLVDVTRGYTAEETRNLAHVDHEYTLRSLGREWKRSQGGLGTDLSDIYRDRYQGDPATKNDP